MDDVLDIIGIIGGIFGIIGGIVAAISWVKSKLHAKEAKESEEKAKQYAENANNTNIAAKRLYDEILLTIEQNKPELARKKLKEKARIFVCKNTLTYTQNVANHLGIQKEEAFELLYELVMVDNFLECAGLCTKENIDGVMWRSK